MADRKFVRVISARLPQILHVRVGAQADVVRQIPAGMIRVFVNDDVIGIPIPSIDEADVIRCDAKIESVEPETARTSAC